MASNPDKSTGAAGSQGAGQENTGSSGQGNDAKVSRDFNRKEDFGDDFEVEQEDRITEEEAKTEKGNRPGNRPERH